MWLCVPLHECVCIVYVYVWECMYGSRSEESEKTLSHFQFRKITSVTGPDNVAGTEASIQCWPAVQYKYKGWIAGTMRLIAFASSHIGSLAKGLSQSLQTNQNVPLY